ncbi:hypothetical protein [Streptomyces chrestomyceticus]|uniref:hypothetical protein n=1 Tax=Streptomyces chrestomyceticus TaxID=68185 RepID=UPI0033FE0C4C
MLARYAAQPPLTIRQIWYALVSDDVLAKQEHTYKRLVELCGMARRSGRIPWEAIRDDTETATEPPTFTGVTDFHQAQLETARAYRLDRQAGQPARIELFCETAGMAPQLAAVTEPFGVPYYSGSGYNSLPGKRGAARRAAEGGHHAVHIMVISEWGPSDIHLLTALAEDITAFAAPGAPFTFERLTVTEAQITELGLPTVPAKATDRRSFASTSTTQAEAQPSRPDRHRAPRPEDVRDTAQPKCRSGPPSPVSSGGPWSGRDHMPSADANG